MSLDRHIDPAKIFALQCHNHIAVGLDEMMYSGRNTGTRPLISIRKRNGNACVCPQPVEKRKQAQVSGTLGQQPMKRHLVIQKHFEPSRANGVRHRICVRKKGR